MRARALWGRGCALIWASGQGLQEYGIELLFATSAEFEVVAPRPEVARQDLGDGSVVVGGIAGCVVRASLFFFCAAWVADIAPR